jgi:hypothetical protein
MKTFAVVFGLLVKSGMASSSEAIEPGRFSRRQKRISRIERDLDISFGPVTDWDQMPPSDGREALDEGEGIEIIGLSDITMARSASAPRNVSGMTGRAAVEVLDDQDDPNHAENIVAIDEKVRRGFPGDGYEMGGVVCTCPAPLSPSRTCTLRGDFRESERTHSALWRAAA